MAEAGSWPAIQRHGLLSTTALLSLYEISGEKRDRLESARRPESVPIEHLVHGTAWVRDNKRVNETVLRRTLVGMTEPEFYRLLNGRVFLWLTEKRLAKLRAAPPYRGGWINVSQVMPGRLSAWSRLLAVVVGLVVGLALVGVVLVRGFDLFPSLPFGSERIDRSTPALLLRLENVSEYRAATGTFQVVVDDERNVRWVPSIFSGERTSFLATGSVDAVVDFSGLDAETVSVSDDRSSVVFLLPPARMDAAKVDLENSRVLSRDRGLLERVGGAFSDNPTSEREVTMLAVEKLDAAAAESDLRRRAEENTRIFLTGLVEGLGYDDVEVRFDAADGL